MCFPTLSSRYGGHFSIYWWGFLLISCSNFWIFYHIFVFLQVFYLSIKILFYILKRFQFFCLPSLHSVIYLHTLCVSCSSLLLHLKDCTSFKTLLEGQSLLWEKKLFIETCCGLVMGSRNMELGHWHLHLFSISQTWQDVTRSMGLKGQSWTSHCWCSKGV